MRYFESPDCSESIRIEALGSAVANAVAAVHLLVASGVAEIKRVKSKELLVTYEGENGHQSQRPTTHLKYELERSKTF